MNRYFGLASADLVVPNQEAWGLLWDFTALRQLVDTLPGNTPYVLSRFPFPSTNLTILCRLQNKALVASNAIMNVFDKGDADVEVRSVRSSVCDYLYPKEEINVACEKMVRFTN
jgi:alpha-mannosidase